MYETFSSASRAQGLPPVGDQQIQEWLDVLAEGLNVVAWDVDAEPADQPASEDAEPADQPVSEDAEAADQPASGVEAGQTERAVGHACLLDCGDGTFELSIFVHQDYQLAGIGSRLIRGLLGFGQEQGVKRVWLTVERSNHIAMSLYRSVGFESASAAGIEHEMELQLTS